MTIRVLVADDQAMIRGALAGLLDLESDIEVVAQAADGAQALDELARLASADAPAHASAPVDVAIIDVEMPRMDGITMMMKVREKGHDFPVIMLSAKSEEVDKIMGLNMGADDYITKPFVIGALQRKIKAMFAMLEHHKPAKDIYDDRRLFLDFSEQTASLNGKPLTLSPMEYKMLNLFRKNPRQVLTRGQLLEKLWDIDEKFVDEHTLTTSISRIRSKIESDGGAPYIKTVYGMGYQWTGGEAK